MKRKVLLILFGLNLISLNVVAQQYPPEWTQYTSGGYIFDIQSDCNNRNLSETEFKEFLLNQARSNIAKQIQMQVQDYSELKKEAINGITQISYSSESRFATNVELKLVGTRAFYNPETREGCAIAYINKEAACQYYQNEIDVLLSRMDKSMAIAHDYIAAGFKKRAQTELEAILSDFETVDMDLFWLNIFGFSQSMSEQLLTQRNARELSVKGLLAELQYGTTLFLTCETDVFGERYGGLQNELKGVLSPEGCNFTNDAERADWIIRVKVSAREYNHMTMNSHQLYFAYADADISIDKVVSSQRVYEDRISVKGGHTMGYKEAAKAAFKDLKEELGRLILQYIQQ